MEKELEFPFEFYRRAMDLLNRNGIPFLVGGAYAFEKYTGIARHTRDFDIFLRYRDLEIALAAFARAGYQAEFTYDHWLGKVYENDAYIDLIFASGNALCAVDELWFSHAVKRDVFGLMVDLCPAEEIIWSKSFIMERERFDGADILHILSARAESLDWTRLVRRFGSHWRVLLSHLILFGYVYPSERARIPAPVMKDLLGRFKDELSAGSPQRVCRGTILSRAQYLVDIELQGYADARLMPAGPMSQEQILQWTQALKKPAQDESGRLIDSDLLVGAQRGTSAEVRTEKSSP